MNTNDGISIEKCALFSLSRTQSGVLKGIAILLVVLGHMGYITWGGAGGVAIFLIVSGYGISNSVENKGLRGYWKKRIKTVWVPYVFVSIALLAGSCITDKKIIAFSLLGLDFGYIADATMWYISYIMIWYGFYYFSAWALSCFKWGEKSYLIKSALMTALMVISSFGVGRIQQYGVWPVERGAQVYLFAFPLGVFLASLEKIKVNKIIHEWIWFVILIAATAYSYAVYNMAYDAWMALAWSAMAVSIVILIRIERVEKVLIWLGKYSYPIYLFEMIMINKRGEWFNRFGSSFITDLCAIAATFLTAVVYQKVLDKILQK